MSGRYPIHPGHKGLETSRAAADAFAPKATPIRLKALAQIERGPRSAEMIAEEIGHHFMVVRARCSELRAQGLITDSGQRGLGALGGRVVIWRATDEAERSAFRARKAAEAEHGEGTNG